jgi:hypothetical protein
MSGCHGILRERVPQSGGPLEKMHGSLSGGTRLTTPHVVDILQGLCDPCVDFKIGISAKGNERCGDGREGVEEFFVNGRF